MKKISFFLFVFSFLIKSSPESSDIFLQELHRVKSSPSQKFVYLNDEIKEIIVALKRENSAKLSPEFIQLSEYIDFGGTITHYDIAKKIMDECSLFDHTDAYKKVLLDYAHALENGDALITIEEILNEKTQTRHTKVTCSLIVQGFLKVCGSTAISDTLCVGGKATLGSLTVLGNALIKGTLIVNGVEITGSSTTSGGGGNVVGPASSTDNAVVLFDGTTGKLIKQSPAPVTIDTSNNLNAVNNINMNGDLNMLATNAAGTQGVINIGGARFAHIDGSTTNTFVGITAGNFTMAGTDNTGIGNSALNANNAGDSNTAVGTEALVNNDSGNNNTAIGSGALLTNTAGTSNTAVGRAALGNSTGNNNIGIGDLGGVSIDTGSNNIAIGNSGVSGESDAIRIGTEGTQATCFIQGIFGQPIVASTPVIINVAGQLGTNPSSARYKHSINELPDMLPLIRKLRPVSFKYKPEISDSQELQYGLIAEEVGQVFPEIVIKNQDGSVETVQYHLLPVILLKALQNLIDKNQELEKRVDELSYLIQK